MKKCKKCGKELLDEFKLCPYCGETAPEISNKDGIEEKNNEPTLKTNVNKDIKLGDDEKNKPIDKNKDIKGENSKAVEYKTKNSNTVDKSKESNVNNSKAIGKSKEVKPENSKVVDKSDNYEGKSKKTKTEDELLVENGVLPKKRKKKKLIITILVVLFFGMFVISSCSTYNENKARQEEAAKQQLVNTYNNYVISCRNLGSESYMLLMYSGIYSDDLMKVWSKHVYGGLDKAIESFMKKNKDSVDKINSIRDKAKDLYYKNISSIPAGLENDNDIKALYDLSTKLNKSQNDFIEITLNPLGNYNTYSSERVSKYNEYKSDLDALKLRAKAVMENKNIPSDYNETK